MKFEWNNRTKATTEKKNLDVSFVRLPFTERMNGHYSKNRNESRNLCEKYGSYARQLDSNENWFIE